MLPVVLASFLALPAASAPPAVVSPAERQAAGRITANALRAHVKFLSSDLLEGRGPGSRGDRLARKYLAAQLESMGLAPGAPGGGWQQKVPLVGIASHVPDTMTFTAGAKTLVLRGLEDYVAGAGTQTPNAAVENAEVVFVGYGIVAPEYGWNDYQGVDVRGRIVMVMNNDPAGDPKLFGGKTRLRYGRWDYKYEEAARQGAAGVIIIHTEPSAAYPWQVVQTSFAAERFELPADDAPRLQLQAWLTEAACRRLAALGGQDLDRLRASAESRKFRAAPLKAKLSFAMTNTITRTESANVIGVLRGSDPRRAKEAVIYTAHHDHLGLKEDARPGEDAIYNGALDNASGLASVLAIAGAFTALPKAPARSVYFAFVAGEEQGLLGSEYLARHPPVPAGRIAANVNVDGMSIWGRARDISVIGLGKSSLDRDILALASMQGRTVVGDEFPDRGSFYRSDQYSFARIGVPAAYLHSGSDVIGKPAGWGREQVDLFTRTDYHQPSDEYRESWDLSGAVEDAQLDFYLGVALADAPAMPLWNAGDEFEATRKKALAAAGP